MMRNLLAAGVLLGVLALGACSEDSLGPVSAEERSLAVAASAEADAVAQATETDARHWLRRLFERLRQSDDPEAQACLAEARALRDQARAAFDAGNREEARQLLHASFLKVLCAVVEVFPDAPARTGAAVDQALARIEERLGDREAPRLRRVLGHVRNLRAAADAALANGDAVTALALNLRSMHILQRLVDHLRHRRGDEDNAQASGELSDMSAGSI